MSDIDLLVAGAGGGLAGALRAAQLGMEVVVVEANEHYARGNNTSMSTAMIPGAGSRFQRAARIDDSPERFLADIRRKTHGDFASPVARALAEVSAELVEWLADHLGIPIDLPTDFSYPGHSAQRLHTIPERHGAALLRHLIDAVGSEPTVDMLAPCRLKAVHSRPVDGEFLADLEHPDGTREEVTAGAVLLATNGYAAEPSLVVRHQPEIAAATYHGSEYSTGDALRIGTELGAGTGYLDAYQGHAALSAAAKTLLTWTTVMHGAVAVNTDGSRFCDESTGYSECATTLTAQPGATGWLVFDERVHELSLRFADYRDVRDSGAIRHANSVAELAAAIEVPKGNLAEELAEAEAVANGGRAADRFGRTYFEQPLKPSLKAVRIVPALFHSQGGLLVDGHARVLTAEGHPISALYAAGGAAVGISGHGAAGYLAGNGLLPALGLAYLAAGHAANRADHLAPSDTSGNHVNQLPTPER